MADNTTRLIETLDFVLGAPGVMCVYDKDGVKQPHPADRLAELLTDPTLPKCGLTGLQLLLCLYGYVIGVEEAKKFHETFVKKEDKAFPFTAEELASCGAQIHRNIFILPPEFYQEVIYLAKTNFAQDPFVLNVLERIGICIERARITPVPGSEAIPLLDKEQADAIQSYIDDFRASASQ